MQVGGAGSGSGRDGSGSQGEGVEGWDWSWEGLTAAASQRWEDWKGQPQRWADAVGSAGQEWHQAARQAGRDLSNKLSWQAFEGWQERHWRAFEARQRARLEALTEEQRQRWEELRKEGGERWRREVAAFEEWQQRVYAAHNPEAKAQAQPTCPNCRLSFLMLPLLPNIGAALRHFGMALKAGRGHREGTGQGHSTAWLQRDVQRERARARGQPCSRSHQPCSLAARLLLC